MLTLNKVLMLRLDAEMHKKLKALSALRRTSINALVREAVLSHFDLEGGLKKNKRSRQ